MRKKKPIVWHLYSDSIWFRLLTIKIWRTKNRKWAEVSRFQWMPSEDYKTFYLRPLGVLYYLFSLSIEYHIKEK